MSPTEAAGFESGRAIQVSLTNEMQAKISHFGAGFLLIRARFLPKEKTKRRHWEKSETQNKNNAPKIQKRRFCKIPATYWNRTPCLSKKEKNHLFPWSWPMDSAAPGEVFASKGHSPPLLLLLRLFSVLRWCW